MLLKVKYEEIKSKFIKKYGEVKGLQVFNAWVNKEYVNPEAKAFYFTSQEFKALEDDIVEGAFCTGDPDAYNDILTEACLTDIVEQLKSLPITIDDNHESFKDVPEETKFRSMNPIAKVTSAVLDGVNVNVKCVLNKAHAKYQEYKSSIKNGFLHSFSFAFIPVEVKNVDIDGVKHRIVNKVNLLNGCFTGIPVNANATFSKVVLKSLREFEYNESEVNDILRGVVMTNNEEKIVDETPKVEEPVAEEKASVESIEEVKSISDRLDVIEEKLAEKKSLEEEKEAEQKDDAKVEEKSKVDALEKEVADLKALIEKPVLKARVEKTETEVPEVKSKGPLDMIG